jgi:hypothetical protein
MDGLHESAGRVPADPLGDGEAAGGPRGAFVRDRAHGFPGRRNALKVLYDDAEVASVRAAAQLAGLTPTGFVAAAGLTQSGAGVAPASSVDRALLAELLQGRTALGRYGVNLNQAVAALKAAPVRRCGCCRRSGAASGPASGWTGPASSCPAGSAEQHGQQARTEDR